ncbi:MAG: adenylate/guanylate cyclase domain-containing protein [Bryobacteraceae bacterium]|nr:adenylate/guanylate cyclase domain-containing protein [Bryobacteraceae bacterium]
MRFRTKLLLVLSAAAVILNGLAVGVMYRVAERYFMDEFRAKAESIAATIASQIDGDAYRRLQTDPSPERSPDYAAIRDQLRRARDANRRTDTYVQYVFTLHRSAHDANVVHVGINPEENSVTSSPFGEKYRTDRSIDVASERVTVDEAVQQDEFDKGLDAGAPIRDRSGAVVGRLAVSFTSERLAYKQRPLLIGGLLATLFGVIVSMLVAWLLAGGITRPLDELARTVTLIGKGDFDAKPAIDSRDEFGIVARAIEEMTRGLRERETVKSAFARYVSQQVLDSVLVSGALPLLQGVRRNITVLFCDIRGFSTMSEQMPPEEVVQLLNEYFECMVEIIFRHQGTLDKFLGDGLMVIFGAPQEDPEQEEHAIAAAVEMQRQLAVLRDKWRLEGRAPIRVGIGIHSGSAIVGNIGSTQRMEYTAIGDTVNVASRLESATKELGTDILVSEHTYSAIRGSFNFRKVGPIQVKGRTAAVQVYALSADEVTPTTPHA